MTSKNNARNNPATTVPDSSALVAAIHGAATTRVASAPGRYVVTAAGRFTPDVQPATAGRLVGVFRVLGVRMPRTLEDVVGALTAGKKYKRPCSLLIGAGCSASAGVKTAAGFVELIKEHHRPAYDRAKKKTYPHCMAALDSGYRRDLIVDQIRAAKINWAHVAIAQLIAQGYVDRVLTTNFDPLVARACALVGEFPAVYDFAASTTFDPAGVAEKAVFHLHGQSTGFVLMNTEDECTAHGQRLGPLFEDAGRGRIWIVVGYSGDNDPVFKHLAGVTRFEYGLYWVGYLDAEPSQALRDDLLVEGRQAYFVKGYDADRFFVELARKLECFPPPFVERPFSHLRGFLAALTEFDLRESDQPDLLSEVRQRIDLVIQLHEQPAVELALVGLLMAGKYAEVEESCLTLGPNASSSISDMVAGARFLIGNQLMEQAKSATGGEADCLFREAAKKYAGAVQLKPDYHQALNNWGLALHAWARTKTGEMADKLFREAEEKYAEAIRLKPDKDNAFVNWGYVLAARAETKSGDLANALFEQASEKYAEAVRIKPDMHEAFSHWGAALAICAGKTDGEKAEAFFCEAGEKYAEAVRIKPDKHEAFIDWSSMLLVRAQRHSGAERRALLDQAEHKLKQAEAVKRGSGAYNLACVESLRGDEGACRQWLEVARECGTLESRPHLESDPDLDPVRETAWFRDFIASL